MIIISGASDNHFNSIIQFSNSCIKYKNKKDIIILYDLGLNQNNHNKLKIYCENNNIIFEIFNYSKYPDYFNININAGEYAWKSVIIYDVMNKYNNNNILWMDAGNLITGSLDKINDIIEKNYIYSPITSGGILKNRHTDINQGWVHQKTYDLIGENIKGTYNMRAGGTIGINSTIDWVRELITKFKNYSCDKNIIAPEGSNRLNHRQDLSIFTLLYYQYYEKYNFNIINDIINHTFHNDIN